MRNVTIIGGGLAGLVTGIQLARSGVSCTLLEKKSYPFHRVCGEYISNEAKPFLKQNNLFPEEFSPPSINVFQLSSVTGKSAKLKLDLGGFGISRFSFDNWLAGEARKAGVKILENVEVHDVQFIGDKFTINTQVKDFVSDVVIGAYGKRSRLDIQLNREFTKTRSPYAAVKYHIRTEHPRELISLHNFEGGYCGISKVENDVSNLCYLVHREQLRRFGDIETLQHQVLQKNHLLKYIFTNSDFLLPRPEVINEISFATKEPVENHILMAGDAAGMITPLCGNGMAMAIHSAKILAETVSDFCHEKFSRHEMEERYSTSWRKNFSYRLWKGRQIQKLFGSKFVSRFAVNLALYSRPVAIGLVKNTHGAEF